MKPKRPAARLMVTDGDGRLLLFRFTPDDRPPFWCTPGGALDEGESFEAAARRELFEETGHDLDPGSCIAVKHVSFTTIEGVDVDAEERYFAIQVPHGETWFPKDLIPLWRRVLREKAA